MSTTHSDIATSHPAPGATAARPRLNQGRRASDATPRIDLYLFVHKGLRAFLGDTLERCGRMDVADSAEVTDTLAQVRSLIELCRAHLHKEEEFLHPAMEARRPGSAGETRGDHAAQLEAFADIETSVRAVEASSGAQRAAAALGLYHQLALFMAENLEHMHVEETANNEVLWAAYSDEELRALQRELVGAIAPAQMALFLRWMIPAMTPAERALLLIGIKQHAPPGAFSQTVNGLKVHLKERDWNKLMAALAGL